MSKTMLFNPYSGRPRDPRDIQSDPEGILMLDPGEPLLAAAPTPPAEAVTDAMQSAGEAAYDKVLRSTDDRSRVVRAAITAALAAKETGRD